MPSFISFSSIIRYSCNVWKLSLVDIKNLTATFFAVEYVCIINHMPFFHSNTTFRASCFCFSRHVHWHITKYTLVVYWQLVRQLLRFYNLKRKYSKPNYKYLCLYQQESVGTFAYVISEMNMINELKYKRKVHLWTARNCIW